MNGTIESSPPGGIAPPVAPRVKGLAGLPAPEWLGLVLAIGGLLALYVPTVTSLLAKETLSAGLWTRDEFSHGPLILAIALFLLARRWHAHDLAAGLDAVPRAAPVLGWALLAFGCATYALGRALLIAYIEIASMIPVLAGLTLVLRGPDMLKAVRFPLLYLIFMIPLPGFIVEPVTELLKSAVSAVAEWVMYTAGYPVARTGVVLRVGQYQLLVADACAGLRTLFMLEALGVLYLDLVRHPSWTRTVGLALLIVPISFAANVIRVILLSLITFHFGNAAGQGFLHEFSGMVMFLCGLLMTVAVDGFLRRAATRARLP